MQICQVLSSDALKDRIQDGLQQSGTKLYVPEIDKIEGKTPVGVLDDNDDSSESGALLIYTSGTTGKPKGVLHTHGYGISSNNKEAVEYVGQCICCTQQYPFLLRNSLLCY